MPTKRRRHAVTETPLVEAALNELRGETNEEVVLSELVVLGAREKLARVRAERADVVALRKRLADQIRSGDLPVGVDAADEVRRTGWSRPQPDWSPLSRRPSGR